MKKPRAIFVALIAICIILLSGCVGDTEQSIDTILESELLQSHGIEIAIPDSRYYTFMHERRGELEIEVALYVLGEHGRYYFTPGDWTDELIAELVLVSEDGIRFAKNFLGIEVSRPLSFVFNVTEPDENHPLPVWGGGGVINTSTFISIEASLLPTIIVHEAVHAILEYDERRSNFPYPPETSIYYARWLEEGLCDLVDFLFALETEHRYFTNYGDKHLHTAAILSLNNNNNFEDETKFGSRYPQLMSFQTSASFIYFLLEHHGSIEDFMRVFDDIYLMEELFGASMEDMIVEWMTYLDALR